MKMRMKALRLVIRQCTMTSWKSGESPRISSAGRLQTESNARVFENLVPWHLLEVLKLRVNQPHGEQVCFGTMRRGIFLWLYQGTMADAGAAWEVKCPCEEGTRTVCPWTKLGLGHLRSTNAIPLIHPAVVLL